MCDVNCVWQRLEVHRIHCITDYTQQESSAVVKMTARYALYVGYSTLILFTPTTTILRGFDSERI